MKIKLMHRSRTILALLVPEKHLELLKHMSNLKRLRQVDSEAIKKFRVEVLERNLHFLSSTVSPTFCSKNYSEHLKS